MKDEKDQSRMSLEALLKPEFNFRRAVDSHPGFEERVLKDALNPGAVRALLGVETLEEQE